MRPTRRPTDRPATRDDPADRPSDRIVKTAVHLPEPAWRRLRTAALHEGTTMSALVEGLIARHLGGYYTAVRAEKPRLSTGAGGESEAA
jgi:hypothetical protein